MRPLTAALLVTLVLAAAVGANAATTGVSAAQLKAGFRTATGERLLVKTPSSYAGHYVAFDLGVQTMFRKARYGTFTIYLVTGPDVDAEVGELLADAHTGALGTPGPGSIYWEHGTGVRGDSYWLAKRRYGSNVVLTWIGINPVKKTDGSWTKLHKTLVAITKGR